MASFERLQHVDGGDAWEMMRFLTPDDTGSGPWHPDVPIIGIIWKNIYFRVSLINSVPF